jgi:hypothetical protein
MNRASQHAAHELLGHREAFQTRNVQSMPGGGEGVASGDAAAKQQSAQLGPSLHT